MRVGSLNFLKCVICSPQRRYTYIYIYVYLLRLDSVKPKPDSLLEMPGCVWTPLSLLSAQVKCVLCSLRLLGIRVTLTVEGTMSYTKFLSRFSLFTLRNHLSYLKINRKKIINDPISEWKTKSEVAKINCRYLRKKIHIIRVRIILKVLVFNLPKVLICFLSLESLDNWTFSWETHPLFWFPL